MKIIFYCYNFYTLFISYIYVSELKKESTTEAILVWRNTIINLPEEMTAPWDHTIVIDIKKIENSIVYKILQSIHLNVLIIKKQIQRIICDNKTHLSDTDLLFVFKDDNIYDVTLIELIYKMGIKKIVLVEEGLGLYTTLARPPNDLFVQVKDEVKRYFYKLANISTNLLKSQGENAIVDIILCRDPGKLPEIKKIDKLIFKQSNLFTKNNINEFIKAIFNLENKILIKKYDIIYFGQPLSNYNKRREKIEIKRISEIFKKIDKKMKIGIKRHQRENKNKYDQIIRSYGNIYYIDEQYQDIPGEFLYYLLGKPIVITPYSSVAKNIKKMDKNAYIILIYRLLDINSNLLGDLDLLFDDENFNILGENEVIKIDFQERIDLEESKTNEEIIEINKIVELL